MTTAAVLGAGSWGTALSVLLAKNGHSVSLWGRDSAEVAGMQDSRENLRYLPGIELPPLITPTDEPPNAASVWVVAVPSDSVRSVCRLIPNKAAIVVASKGLEKNSCLRMSEVVHSELPNAAVAVLSGPNLAPEIARGIPTATVIASLHQEFSEFARRLFACPTFRVYTSRDIVGVELGGALKNVLALGAGMSDGLGFGDNTKGALLARGLHEMSELGTALGAEMATFLGLSGVGDLFATAVSGLSRNYRVGKLLGSGSPLANALREVGQVAEGISTSEAAVTLADRVQVEIPLMHAIYSVVTGKARPAEAVGMLMERAPKAEV